jgi:hypothetical protein
VAVVVTALCQVGGEPFGVGAVGAGGVPAASFASGDRVGSFVDDGVVAVALAGHVSLHVDVLLGSGRHVSAVEHIGRSRAFLQLRKLSGRVATPNETDRIPHRHRWGFVCQLRPGEGSTRVRSSSIGRCSVGAGLLVGVDSASDDASRALGWFGRRLSNRRHRGHGALTSSLLHGAGQGEVA